jgi:hypothetical protein
MVLIYVCPTEGCNNYYGASSMPDLSKEKVFPSTANGGMHVPARFTRDECPDCRQNGKSVKRLRKAVIIPEEMS